MLESPGTLFLRLMPNCSGASWCWDAIAAGGSGASVAGDFAYTSSDEEAYIGTSMGFWELGWRCGFP